MTQIKLERGIRQDVINCYLLQKVQLVTAIAHILLTQLENDIIVIAASRVLKMY